MFSLLFYFEGQHRLKRIRGITRKLHWLETNAIRQTMNEWLRRKAVKN